MAALALTAPAFVYAQQCPPQPEPLTGEEVQAMMREARDRGFLWRIEKAGRTGYVYGSIHVSKREWALPGGKIMAALKQSDTIALELDVMDPEVQKSMGDLASLGIKPLVLPPERQKRMTALAVKGCMTSPGLEKQHAMLQLVTVVLLDARFAGFEAAYGTEIFLSGFGRAVNKPVISLETAGAQLRALLGGDPAETLLDIDRAMTLIEQGKGRSKLDRLAGNWASGNLRDLEDYAKWCECADSAGERAALMRINDDRNPGLAAGIDNIMRNGRSVFAAVGALHMTGPKAIPKLLADMGYTVTRIALE